MHIKWVCHARSLVMGAPRATSKKGKRKRIQKMVFEIPTCINESPFNIWPTHHKHAFQSQLMHLPMALPRVICIYLSHRQVGLQIDRTNDNNEQVFVIAKKHLHSQFGSWFGTSSAFLSCKCVSRLPIGECRDTIWFIVQNAKRKGISTWDSCMVLTNINARCGKFLSEYNYFVLNHTPPCSHLVVLFRV